MLCIIIKAFRNMIIHEYLCKVEKERNELLIIFSKK